MGSFPADKRDVVFTLYEEHALGEVLGKGPYAGIHREDCDMVLDEARRFADEVLAPINSVLDRKGLHFEDGRVTMPPEHRAAWGKFREGGWVGIHSSPEYGGMGMPAALSLACSEFFIGACGSFTLTGELTSGSAHLIEAFGTPELRERFVRNMYSGRWTGTMCLTEPQAGSAVGDSRTTAVPEGDHFNIRGTKIFISSGEHDLAENIVHLVLGRLPDAPPGTRGISLFVVPKVRVNADGTLGTPNDVTCGNVEHKLGIKGSPTCTMLFGENGGCHGYLVGDAHQGMRYMFQMMNEARIAVGLQGEAMAAAAFGHALRYAQQRVQGVDYRALKDPDAPRVTITKHPHVRRMLMHQKALVEGMRTLLFGTAAMIDRARVMRPGAEREAMEDRVALLTPVCKGFGSDMGFRCIELALQTHGGYGYTQDYAPEQLLRDSKIASLYEGTNGIQALDLVGRKLPMKGGSVLMGLLMEMNQWVEEHRAHPGVGPLTARWEHTRDAFAATVMHFMQSGMGGDLLPGAMNAVPFLHAMGHVLASHALLRRAVIAEARLAELLKARGVDPADADARAAAIRGDDDEIRFYGNKLPVASYYVQRILPEAHGLCEGILSGDTSPMQVTFDEMRV